MLASAGTCVMGIGANGRDGRMRDLTYCGDVRRVFRS